MDRERKQLKDEAADVSGKLCARLSETQEELEFLREALLRSGAETRRWWAAPTANNEDTPLSFSF